MRDEALIRITADDGTVHFFRRLAPGERTKVLAATVIAESLGVDDPAVLHRDGGPAIETPAGDRSWFHDGMRHRDGGPAVIRADGQREWHREGELHRDDGPAIIRADGALLWYLEGRLHRDGAPALIDDSRGAWKWYRHGLAHREGDPAQREADGTVAWFLNGRRHRTDGPAVTRPDGSEELWLEGVQLSWLDWARDPRTVASVPSVGAGVRVASARQALRRRA